MLNLFHTSHKKKKKEWMLSQCSKIYNSDDGNNDNWFLDQQKVKDFKRKSDVLYCLGN